MWYVCYCEPKRALPLCSALTELGKVVECPSFEFKRRQPRKKRFDTIRRPLIGGIFFCHINSWPLGNVVISDVNLNEIRRMNWQGSPARITDDEINILRQSALDYTESRIRLKIGERARVLVGPYRDRVGVITRKERGSLVLNLDDAQIPLKVSPFLLGPVEA
jgi:hypothetical protein